MKKLVLSLLISLPIWGQGQSVDFSAPPPAPVSILSVNPSGATGTTSYYYSVVATYPIGSVVSAPFLITNSNATLSGSNFNTVFWSPALGATSYTVLRSTSTTVSLPCAACVVASGITGNSQTDQSNSLGASNITLAQSASGYIRINNRDFTAARLQSSLPFQLPQIIFPDGTSMISANAGVPTGPAGGVLNGTYPNPGLANSSVANANLQNSATTVNGQTCTLGAACTVTAPGSNATYITQVPDSNLSAEQALSLLSTGILKSTNATGVVSTAASSDVISLFTGCSGLQYLGADGACHAVSSGSSPTINCSAFATVKLCVDSAVAAGGGVVAVTTPGTYTIAQSIKLGSSTALGDATNTRVILEGGPGVILDCTVTDYSDCFRLADGAGIRGIQSTTVASSGFGFRIQVHNTAGTKVNWLIAPMLKDGSIESNWVDGVQLVGGTTASILCGLLDIRAIFASSVYRNISTANPGLNTNSIQVHNASNQALSLSGNLTGSGTTVTVTTNASTTSERDGHHTWINGKVNVTGCADASFNGTNLVVLSILSNTSFTYQAAGAVGASSATCTVRPVTVSAIASVILLDNIWANCNANSGCKPLVINAFGAGDVGAITVHHSACEGAGTGNAGCTVSRDNDGTGATMENIAFTGTTHLEPDNADTTTCSGILVNGPVNGMTIDSIDSSGANATNSCAALRITSTPNGVKLLGTIRNNGWFYTYNAPNEVSRENIITGTAFIGALGVPQIGDYCGNPSMACYDDAFPHNSTASGSIGQQGWVLTAVAGTFLATYVDGKGVTLTTSASAGQGGNMSLAPGAVGMNTYLNTTVPWIQDFGFSLTQVTDTTFYSGLGVSATNPPANGVGCRFDTSLGDTTFQFISALATVITVDDTGIVPVAANDYRCQIRNTGTAGKVTFNLINGTTGALVFGPRTFCPAGCNVTATLATATNVAPTIGLLSASGGGGAAKAMKVYYERFRQWGLTR